MVRAVTPGSNCFMAPSQPCAMIPNDDHPVEIPMTGRKRRLLLLACWMLLLALPAAAQPVAYVTSTASSISVIDTSSNTEVTKVPVGSNAVAVVVSSDGKRAYFADKTLLGTVQVMDTATNSVVASVLVGSHPAALAITPDGSRLYVTTSTGYIKVVSTAANAVTGAIYVGGLPTDVAITPDGTRVCVTEASTGTVVMIDAATNAVVARVPVGLAPFGLSITPDGARVYVANVWSRNVSVLDLSTNAVIATIPLASDPRKVAITPDGTRAYVTLWHVPDNIAIIDTATNTVVDTIAVANQPVSVAFTPDGARAYITSYSAFVTVIDVAAGSVMATVRVERAWAVATSPDGARAYVAIGGSTVKVVDTTTNNVVGAIGLTARRMAFTPDGTRAYATGSSVCVIDRATHKVSGCVPGTQHQADPANGIAITPDGKRAYAARSGAVWVIDTTTNTVITEVPTLCCDPSGVAVTPDGARVYVTVNSGRVVVIDTIPTPSPPILCLGARRAQGMLRLPPTAPARMLPRPISARSWSSIPRATRWWASCRCRRPGAWRLPRMGAGAYVVAFKVVCDGASCGYVGVVATIDLQTDTIVASLVIPVGADPPGGVAITPDGSRVHVTMSSRTLVIDTSTNTVTATVNFGAIRVTDVAISPF